MQYKIANEFNLNNLETEENITNIKLSNMNYNNIMIETEYYNFIFKVKDNKFELLDYNDTYIQIYKGTSLIDNDEVSVYIERGFFDYHFRENNFENIYILNVSNFSIKKLELPFKIHTRTLIPNKNEILAVQDNKFILIDKNNFSKYRYLDFTFNPEDDDYSFNLTNYSGSIPLSNYIINFIDNYDKIVIIGNYIRIIDYNTGKLERKIKNPSFLFYNYNLSKNNILTYDIFEDSPPYEIKLKLIFYSIIEDKIKGSYYWDFDFSRERKKVIHSIVSSNDSKYLAVAISFEYYGSDFEILIFSLETFELILKIEDEAINNSLSLYLKYNDISYNGYYSDIYLLFTDDSKSLILLTKKPFKLWLINLFD
ncbi:MAG: hypothetical protein U0457_13855 [Candidatus Sericytochromatia bacterium]